MSMLTLAHHVTTMHLHARLVISRVMDRTPAMRAYLDRRTWMVIRPLCVWLVLLDVCR